MMPTKNESSGRVRGLPLKALIPAGGLGSRLAPVTLTVPKELLPFHRRPLIHWAVEEALQAGIRQVGIVIRSGKEQIADYFKTIRSAQGDRGTDWAQDFRSLELHYFYQDTPLGVGNAIYIAKRFIQDQPFIMILPDQLLISPQKAVSQLTEAIRLNTNAVWSTVVKIPQAERCYFPGARAFKQQPLRGKTLKIEGFDDEISSGSSSSLVGFGRTYFPAGCIEFFSCKYVNQATGEVDLLPTFNALFKRFKHFGLELTGRPVDLGTWPGYEHYSTLYRL